MAASFPEFRKIDHVHVYVADVEEAVRWYARVLGLERDPKFEQWAREPGGPVTLVDANETVHLALFERSAADNPMNVALATSATAFVEWRERIEGLGVRTTLKDHGLAWSLYFADPWGNQLELTSYEHASLRERFEQA